MILYRIVLIIDDSPQFMSIKIIATLCKTGDVFLSTIWFCKHSSMWLFIINHDVLYAQVISRLLWCPQFINFGCSVFSQV